MAKVRAAERGYYGGKVREEGEEFDFTGPGARPDWMELVAFGGKGDHDGDGMTGGSVPKTGGKPLTDMTVTDLREVAGARGIDLAGLTKKADILAAIEGGAAKTDTVDAPTADPFADAPEPQTLVEAQKAMGGIEPDWVPKEHQPPQPVND